MGPDPEVREFGEGGAPKLPDVESVSSSGGKLVRTVWPHGDFVVEDAPTVTRDGVELSGDTLNRVVEAAKVNGVKIRVEGDS